MFRLFVILSLLAILAQVHSAVDNGGQYDSLLNSEELYPEFKSPKFVLWSNASGPNIILPNGTVKIVDTYWLGLNAWNKTKKIEERLTSTLFKDHIPYIHINNFNNMNPITCRQAIAFDKKILSIMKSSFAVIDFESDWDVTTTLVGTKKGSDCLEKRIKLWRKSKNFVLLSSVTLEQVDAQYETFSKLSHMFDLHSVVHHVVSHTSDCTWRTDGGNMTKNGKSFEEALNIVQELMSKQDKISRLTRDKKSFVVGDAAITSCSWDGVGQSRILSQMVDKMCDLIKNRGFHGMNLRSYSPHPQLRSLGHNNEGKYVWGSNADAKNQLQRGHDLAVRIMTNMETACKDTTPVTVKDFITIKKHLKASEDVLSVIIDPIENIKQVVAIPSNWKGHFIELVKSSTNPHEYSADIKSRKILKSSTVKIVVTRRPPLPDKITILDW
ncbi:leucine zipper protein [Acrasis kona]|uniref:Leucine zipper protein n=1 Tax=Acrasis kona TaxID=1008807 RepID=A0AAW2ZPB7_9EUKA